MWVDWSMDGRVDVGESLLADEIGFAQFEVAGVGTIHVGGRYARVEASAGRPPKASIQD